MLEYSVLNNVHNAYPTKMCISQNNGQVLLDFLWRFKWHTKNVVIGSMRNWSKIALEWNLPMMLI
jgi:glucosylceramidase